jgi:hypothetical protein
MSVYGLGLAVAVGAAVVFTPFAARADDPPVAPSTAAPAAPPVIPAHGAVVIAHDAASVAAARSLARELYREAALRPSIDEPTASALSGGAVAADAPAKLREIAELRAQIEKAESPVVARRLLASIGSDAHAEIVLDVAMSGDRPVARVVRVATAEMWPVEIGATVVTDPDGTRRATWPGAAQALAAILAPKATQTDATSPPPLAPTAPATPLPAPPKKEEPSRYAWSSPWFWAGLGVVAAAGATVFAVSRASAAPGDVHLSGRIPQ